MITSIFNSYGTFIQLCSLEWISQAFLKYTPTDQPTTRLDVRKFNFSIASRYTRNGGLVLINGVPKVMSSPKTELSIATRTGDPQDLSII